MNVITIDNSNVSTELTIPLGPAAVLGNQTETETELLTLATRQVIDQVLVFLMLPFSLMGVCTNLLNIRVFLKQGVRHDSANVGFVSLSVLDLLSCATLIPYCVCYLNGPNGSVPYRLTCIAYATLFLASHIIVQKTGAWTTVIISVMRCLCVVIPMKVKTLFTPKVTFAVIAFIFALFFFAQMGYSVFFIELVWVYDTTKYNTSIAYILDLPSGREYIYYYSLVSNQILSSVAIVTVAVATGVMVYKLYQVKKWRHQNNSSTITGSGSGQDCPETGAASTSSGRKPLDSTSSGRKPLASTSSGRKPLASTSSGRKRLASTSSGRKPLASKKDVELVQSVVTAASIFLVCVSITYIPTTAMILLPGINFNGLNKNLFEVLYMVRFLFDAINSSINFFFYIRVSSRYKAAFLACFHSSKSTTTNALQ